MAKMSKAQYSLLTEAFGEALADIQDTQSPLLENTALRVAGKVARNLKYDNPNFNERQFIDGIKSTAELAQLSKKGINL